MSEPIRNPKAPENFNEAYSELCVADQRYGEAMRIKKRADRAFEEARHNAEFYEMYVRQMNE